MKFMKKILGVITAAALMAAPLSMVVAPVVAYAATEDASQIDAGEIKKPTVKVDKAKVKKTTATLNIGGGKGIAGYEIQYSKNKNFKNAKKTTAKYDATSKKLSKLKKNTTYYARVRSYKTVSAMVDGKKKTVKIYTGWKTVKFKTAKK